MNLICIGDIVNTHGIKGEIRIKSEFKFKKDIFKKGNIIYLGFEHDKHIISSYRVHKGFDMITLEGVNDINEVLMYKGDQAYINRDDYKFKGLLDEDMIGFEVYADNRLVGVIDSFMKSSAHPIVVINGKTKKHLVPFIDEFIINIDAENKRVDLKVIEGLIDED